MANPDRRPQLESTSNALADAIRTVVPDGVDAFAAARFSRIFGRFRGTVRTAFTHADLELVGLCKKLQQVRQDLGDAIRSLQHE